MSPAAPVLEIAGVRLTHPDKQLYPEEHVAKRDLALYYEAAAGRMLPHVSRRLVSVVRCPDGRGEPCFFQRHPIPGSPDRFTASSTARRRRRPTTSISRMCVASSRSPRWASLRSTSGVRAIDDIDHPDRLVFDLDPAEDVPFTQVKAAALHLRDLLEAVRLKSFPLLTGGKGIHVVVPLRPHDGWDVIKAFSGALAQRVAAEQPDRYVATMTKAKRNGRIFIDYFRNDKSATAIAPYSTRSRAGATLAWPVSWKALPRVKSASEITLANFRRRLANADPWSGYEKTDQTLEPAALKALGVDG